MAESVSRPPAAEIVLHGLDVIEVLLGTADQLEAIENARSMLVGLDEETLRRVATWLADTMVRNMRAKTKHPGSVQRWVDRMRIEALADLPAVEPDRCVRAAVEADPRDGDAT